MEKIEAPATKVCRKCGAEKPINQYRRILNSPDGYTHICSACINYRRKKKQDDKIVSSKQQKGANPALANFTPRELIDELRSRCYHGELHYTHTIKL